MPTSGGRYLDLRRSMLPPGRVRELSRRQPGRVVRDTALAWAVIVGVWAAAAVIHTWWAIALAAVIAGNRYYTLWIIAHDGLHRRLFDKTSTNDLFCDLLALAPIGAITRINNRNHLRHHQYLGTEDDPDRHKHACFNKSTPVQLASYLIAASSVLQSVGHVYERPARSTTDERPKYGWRDVAILLGWQGALFALFTWRFGWWGYFALWWAPLFVFVFLADNLRTFVEHSQPEGDQGADGRRLVTNQPGWLERQLLAPLNMHYHAAHHLWPSIPYYNLPLADAEMRRSPLADAVTWRGSYFGYLRRYYQALPLADCRPASVVA